MSPATDRGGEETGVYVRRVLIAAAIGLLAAFLFVGIRHLSHVLLVLFAGLLLATVLDGFAQYLRDHARLPRKASVVAVLVLGVAALGLLAWWLGPKVGVQMADLLRRLPDVARDLRGSLEASEPGRTLLGSVDESGSMLPPARQLLGGVTGAFSTVLGAVVDGVVVLFLCLYLAYDPPLYRDAVVRCVPEPARERLREVLHALGGALQRWMLGRLASMAVVGALTASALAIAGIPLALALGLIAAVLSFVPFIGPILSAVPAVLIGLGEGPREAALVVLIYLAVQGVESYVITPLIQRKVVSLAPALIITAQVLMGVLFGILGIFLATPVAVVGVVAVRRLYLEDTLGQEMRPLGSG